jgi:regulation of enolase protein 1 (concanavalin A-like superfamily)
MNSRENGAGILAGWRGATTDNYGTPSPDQPRIGHPFPGLGWYSKEIGRQQRLNIYRNLAPTYETRLVEHDTFVMSPGVPYKMKFRVDAISADTAQYSLKVWEVGTTEPSQFQLTAQSARRSGSILLGAHRADVSFGNITVTPLALPPDTTAPVISTVAVTPSGDGATVTWTTDEASTSKVEYGQTLSYGSMQQDTALVTSHSVNIGPILCGTQYHYAVSSADAAGNSTTAPDATFMLSCPSGIQSDAFSGNTLDGRWTVIDPKGDVPDPTMTGTEARIDIPAGSSHDEWTGNLSALQMVQGTADVDFDVQAKWNSAVTQVYQYEGIVARANDTNLLRFDVVRTSATNVTAFAAAIVNGTASQKLALSVSATSPIYQRVTRTGNSWTYRISTDGTNWTTVGTFTHTLAVSQVGVLVGNHATTPSNSPAFSALLDYFHNLASPLADD